MKSALTLVCVGALAGSVHAQLVEGFELPGQTGSAGGTTMAAPWYNPVVAPSMPHNVHTYAGNSLGLVPNPVGANQFLGGVSAGGSSFARAQYNIDFTAGTWTLAYDMAAQWSGVGSSALNLSSFSLQHDTVPANQFKAFIALNNFVDLANPSSGWKAEFNVFDAAGTAVNNASPGAPWTNLDINHWYRQQITIDLSSNRILSIALLDLHNLSVSVATPADWYMTGGASSALALPNGVRFFVGGAAGNTMGWDNLFVVPAPGALPLLAAGLAIGLRRRRP